MIFEKKLQKFSKKKFQKIFIASIPQYEYVLTFPKVLFTCEYTWQNLFTTFVSWEKLHRVYLPDTNVVNQSFAMCIHR